MPMTQPIDYQRLYEEAGQEHVFKYWSTLSRPEQDQLLAQLAKLPEPAKFLADVHEAINYSATVAESKEYEPLPCTNFSSALDTDAQTKQRWARKGLDLLRAGKVGVVLLAGGQGSRLGSTAPKGTYNVGLPSNKCMFELQCDQIVRIKQLAGPNTSLPLYIMTSKPTRKVTEQFFKDHDYFGLPPTDVIFFNQGVLPAVDIQGDHLLMATKNSLVESPNGNGGLYKAMHEDGIIRDMTQRGIEHLHMYCVDNILVKVADPEFLGYSVLGGYNVATKVVRKTVAAEKVGLIVLDKTNNCPCVIEYSEIDSHLSEMKDPANTDLLRFRAANIVNHYYNVKFLETMIPQWSNSRRHLPYHIAKKNINCLDTVTGKTHKADGIKMEQFIFDVFPSVSLDKFGCLEVAREEEFSPLKNAPGTGNSCPETCLHDRLARSTRWVQQAGGFVTGPVEVSSTTSYNGEGLAFVKGRTYNAGSVI